MKNIKKSLVETFKFEGDEPGEVIQKTIEVRSKLQLLNRDLLTRNLIDESSPILNSLSGMIGIASTGNKSYVVTLLSKSAVELLNTLSKETNKNIIEKTLKMFLEEMEGNK